MSSYTGVITIPYTFSTTTTNSDPGSGNLRLNSASQASSTAIYASDTDANGVDWTAALEGVTVLAAALFAHGMATLVEHGLARLHGDGLSYEMPTPNVAA